MAVGAGESEPVSSPDSQIYRESTGNALGKAAGPREPGRSLPLLEEAYLLGPRESETACLMSLMIFRFPERSARCLTE
jgi:hypothetical protein